MLFRFAFCFWGLFCLGGGTSLALWFWPWMQGKVGDVVSWPSDTAGGWFIRHVIGVTGEASSPHPTGSGDTLLGWVSALLMVILAAAACAVWSAWSERRGRRKEYRTLYAWLRLVMRFVLASAMLSYGFDKVFPLQFPAPSRVKLAQTYGTASPMGLLWTFLGASTAYQIFGGLSEAVAGLLLLFRRTSTAGALIACAVMTNVVVLNFTYDVPVKLYSSELLLMGAFLLLPDIVPMWRFFLRRQEAKLTGVWLRRSERRALRVTAHCLQAFTIVGLLYSTAVTSWRMWQSGQTPLRGTWAVDAATGKLAEQHWAVFNSESTYMVQAGPADKPVAFRVQIVPKQKLVEMTPREAQTEKPQGELHWGTEQAGHMTLTGTWSGEPASVSMHRVYLPKSALETRGFHWVQEYAYNR